MIKKLHFKIHPNILNIIRDAYWFEEGKDSWALKTLLSLDNSRKIMTLDYALKLLEGDAHFITKDGGKTLSIVFKDEKKFKKELARELKRKEEERKALLVINDEEENTEVEEFKSNTLEALIKRGNLQIAQSAMMQKLTAKTDEEREAAESILISHVNKQYSFVFEGHEYTFDDSARNQSQCPHCGKKSSDGFAWSNIDDKESYIGTKDFGNGNLALCFQCPDCHEKFYYHSTIMLETR